MASKPKMIGRTHVTQPERVIEETSGSPQSTREQEIRNRAYEIYLQRGRQPGYELQDWLQAERELSPNLTAVLQQALQNTTNLKVLRQLMTPDAVYVSLNFDNPELKKIEPWAGTHKGPESIPKVFAGIQSFWKTLDFKVTDTIEQGNRVAFFGSFTYKSNTTGKEITSPFSLLARFEGARSLTSNFKKTASAPQARSKRVAQQDFAVILREKRLRSKASQSGSLNRTATTRASGYEIRGRESGWAQGASEKWAWSSK